MTKHLLYVAPIALVALMPTEASPAPAAWSGSIVRNIAAAMPELTDPPLVLVRGGRGGGGGGRGGGGGYRGGGGGGGYAGGSRGGAGGAYRGGGTVARGGGSFAGVSGGNRANINTGNISRNVNVSGGGYGGGYGGYGWGGVAAGVAAGAVVGAAAYGASSYYAAPAPSYYCPYPDYPNCGL